MFIKNWKKEILTIPNLLSLFRLILIPVYVDLYLNARSSRDYAVAAAVMALSCLTDLADGKIARHFHMISHVGKVLDPMADKFTQLALMLCLSARYTLLYPVLILFLTKEVFQLTAVIIHYRRGKALPGALMEGKVCTSVLFVSFIILVLFQSLDPRFVDVLITADALLLLITFIRYIQAYYGKNKKTEDLNHE